MCRLTTIDDLGEWIVNACEAHNLCLVNYDPDGLSGVTIRSTELNICFVAQLSSDAGYSLYFTTNPCGNADGWLEYNTVTVKDEKTGESKTFQCKSYFPPKTYTGKITISVSANSLEEAKEKIVWEANHITTDCHFDITEEN